MFWYFYDTFWTIDASFSFDKTPVKELNITLLKI